MTGLHSTTMLLLAALSASSLAQAQSNPTLFGSAPAATAAPTAQGAAAKPAEKFVKRAKAVTINFGNISKSNLKKLDVELFDGKVVTLVMDRIDQRTEKSYTWYGHVSGTPMSQAILTVVDGYVAGTLFVIDGKSTRSYQIQSDASGTHQLRELDPANLPSDHGGLTPSRSSARELPARSADGKMSAMAAGNVGGGTLLKKVDVAVIYTNQAAAAAGSGIAAQVQNMIDGANGAYGNTGIGTRIRLVYSGPAGMNDSANVDTDMATLSATMGPMRNTYAADAVVLLTEATLSNGTPICGMAANIGPVATLAHVVVTRSCGMSNLSLPHELGHLFGASHDPFVVPAGSAPYSYGQGYVNSSKGWYTVMAYPSKCQSEQVACARYPFFSSPLRSFDVATSKIGNIGQVPNGLPTGNPTNGDNARVHTETSAAMASFRASKAFQETGVFTGPLSNYTITQTASGFTVRDNTGRDVSYNNTALSFDLADTARLKFTNAWVALDLEGSAGKTFRLYQAAFNRAPDLPGLGFWMYHADVNGMTSQQMAAGFMQSAEFINMYGSNPTNADFVTKLYNNVLHRAPDAAGLEFWVGFLNNGSLTRADVLFSFSDSPENRAGVAPAISRGIQYIAYQP